MEEVNQVNNPSEPQEIFIPVKFNKEIRNLSIEEASALSQKGLKYDAISPQWEKLKLFAKQDNMSIADFLSALEKGRTEKRIEELTQQCGGNGEMALRIIALEGNPTEELKGQREFLEYFPNKNTDSLPSEVVDRARENNSNILDEYLRYEARKKALREADEKQKRENLESSVGSQKDRGSFSSPESHEFIRGIWNH
ncbi:MAG: hypothetical protein U0M42_09335 [Acutalibacteraceae bacterium]|nr:hypothetical protein [Acutalibacteraceae bacterium]